MMQYYEDNGKTPVLPVLSCGENKTTTKSIKKFTSKLYDDDGWTLEENDKGERYFTHPYSELKYPILYKNLEKMNIWKFFIIEDSLIFRGNSINKEPNKANPFIAVFFRINL